MSQNEHSQPSILYHTPTTALLGQAMQPGGIKAGVVYRQGPHQVVVIKIEGDQYLVSGPTLYGWVSKTEFYESE